MDATLDLGTSRAELKARGASGNRGVELSQALGAHVLQAVFQTGRKVWDEFGDRTTVGNRAGNTLGNEDAVALGEVAGGASVVRLAVDSTGTGLLILHSIDGTHATIGLDELALAGNEGSSWGLGGAGKETTHHDGSGTESETLDDVANILDATVSHARDAEAGSERRDVVDGCGLGTANCHDFLGNTGRTAAHANAETINSGSDESSSLLAGNDVSADNLESWVLPLDELNHLDLVHAVTLGAIQDNNVEAGFDELLQAELVSGASTNGSRTDQLLRVWEFRGVGEVEVLGEIGTRHHGNQVAGLVNDWELSLLGLRQNGVGLSEGGTLGSSDQIGDHDRRNWLLGVLFKLDVSVRDNTNELGAELSVLFKTIELAKFFAKNRKH